MNYDSFCQNHNVSRETFEQLEHYAQAIFSWQPKLNLVASGTLPDLWSRHILDSLQLASYLPEAETIITDIGSGGGFPAIPLAAATPHQFHLVESDHRKAIFLEEMARQLDLKITVHPIRIETATLPKARYITARACAPLAQLLTWARPHLSTDSKCLFLKGQNYRNEIEDAIKGWSFTYQVHPSCTDSTAAVLELSDITERV